MRNKVLLLAILTCSLSVSIREIGYIHLFFLLLSSFLSVFSKSFQGFDSNFGKLIQLYIFPFILSLFISLPFNYLYNSNYNYYHIDILGRLLNIVIIVLTNLLLYYSIISRDLNIRQVLIFYFVSCLIMLISGLWHTLDLNFGFPIQFPLETRSTLHSGGGGYSLSARVTGLAQEPSYFATFLIDCIILGSFLVRKVFLKVLLVLVCLFVLYFTYSPSSFISLFLIGMLYLLLKYGKRVLNYLPVIVISCLTIFLVLYSNVLPVNFEALNYVFERVDNADSSERFEVISTAINSIIEDNSIFTLFFGNGFKSFQLFPSRFPHLSLETSNNLYVDYFFEAGILGVSFLIFLFLFLINGLLKVKHEEVRIFGWLFFFDLFISSFYRADFSSFRFLFLLTIILIFIKYSDYVRDTLFKTKN